MTDLKNLAKAQFLDSKEASSNCDPDCDAGCDALPCFSCDASPLPPGCDCVCHTPCDFGKNQNAETYQGTSKSEVYEME